MAATSVGRDFVNAVARIDALLADHEEPFVGGWRRQDMMEHLGFMDGHRRALGVVYVAAVKGGCKDWAPFEAELAAIAVRALMILEKLQPGGKGLSARPVDASAAEEGQPG